jgi:hypothetical protein
MRIHRRFLYAGVFLLTLGAVLVAADLRAVDLAAVRDALRYWPVVVILVGVAIVVRRSPAALPMGLLAAGAPGLVLGGAIAIGPRFVVDCASPAASSPATVTRGSFGPPRDLSIRAHCGSLDVRTSGQEPGWTLTVADAAGPAPTVDQLDGGLALDAVGLAGDGPWGDWSDGDGGPSRWELVVPTGDIGAVSAILVATDTTIDLANARVRSVDITSTASNVALDLTSTSIGDVSVVSNFGQLTLYVPSSADLSGSLKVNGGRIVVCTNRTDPLSPIGLRVTGKGFAAGVRTRGTPESDLMYESPGYDRAAFHTELRVNASFGSIDIDPYVGGCK